MRIYSLKLLLPALLLIFLAACQDIIEPNLSKTTINVLAPGNGIVSSSNSVTFWWDQVNGADNYRISVVRPSFSSVQSLIFDSTVTGTKFSYNFTPGTYQWRVRAQNGSSNTPYVTWGFTIDTSSNLSGSKVILSSPVNNSFSNVVKQLFRWASLPNAAQYTFELFDSTNASVYTKALITGDTASYTFALDGKYHWDVKAINSFSVTANVNTFYLTINRTAPSPPSLTFPAYNDTASSPVTLKWQRNSSSVIGDSIYIASDSLLGNVLQRAYSTVAYYRYVFSGTSGTPYFWQVKSIDAAGNRSGWSNLGKFRVK